jgi:hypothetical protein
LLDGLEQDVWVLWVEETLKLAAAGAHPLCHLARADTPFPHRFMTSEDNTRFHARVVTSS